MCARGRRPARSPFVPVCCCLWPHGCSGRRRPRPPARLGGLTSFGAAPRSPPVPSGPSGALHTSGACDADGWLGASPRSPARPRRRPQPPQPGPPHRRLCVADVCLCVASKPGQALPSPSGTVARPRRPRRTRGGLQSGGAWGACALWLCRPHRRRAVPSEPFGAHYVGAARLLVSVSARQDRRLGRWSWSGPERNIAPADCSSAWHASAVKEISPLLG